LFALKTLKMNCILSFQGDFAEARKRVQQCAFLLGESEKIPNAVIGGERLADVVFPDSIIREVVFGCRVVWKEKTCRDLWDRGRRDIEPGEPSAGAKTA